MGEQHCYQNRTHASGVQVIVSRPNTQTLQVATYDVVPYPIRNTCPEIQSIGTLVCDTYEVRTPTSNITFSTANFQFGLVTLLVPCTFTATLSIFPNFMQNDCP